MFWSLVPTKCINEKHVFVFEYLDVILINVRLLKNVTNIMNEMVLRLLLEVTYKYK